MDRVFGRSTVGGTAGQDLGSGRDPFVDIAGDPVQHGAARGRQVRR
jgi:hypothetical protein